MSYLNRENAGLLGLTRVGSRRVIYIAAGFMLFFSILGDFLVHIVEVDTIICVMLFWYNICILSKINQESLEHFLHQYHCPLLLLCTVYSLPMLVGDSLLRCSSDYSFFCIISFYRFKVLLLIGTSVCFVQTSMQAISSVDFQCWLQPRFCLVTFFLHFF